jgi:hypothetical protein
MKKLLLILLLLAVNPIYAGTIYILSGTYAGDNNDDRSISGLGFQPDAVIVIGAGNSWYWKTNSMTAGDNSLPLALTTGYTANYIQALEADGFQVGTALNTAGSTYYYLAVKEYIGYIDTGTYTGNGVDDRNITGVGFQAGFVMIQGSTSATGGVWRCSGVTNDSSFLFTGLGQTYQNEIQVLSADGFQIGTYVQVNTDTKVYHYLAIKDIAGYTASGWFKGNNAANRDITTPGFTGTWVFVQNFTSATTSRTCATEENAASGVAVTSINGAIGSELVDIVANGFRVSANTLMYLNSTNEHSVFWYLKEGSINIATRKNIVVVN